jgi:hypothetical protein
MSVLNHLPPPLPLAAAQFIQFGDCIFSSPEFLTANALIGLAGLESPGLYATASNTPKPRARA